jgi:hypothetical protein
MPLVIEHPQEPAVGRHSPGQRPGEGGFAGQPIEAAFGIRVRHLEADDVLRLHHRPGGGVQQPASGVMAEFQVGPGQGAFQQLLEWIAHPAPPSNRQRSLSSFTALWRK